MSFRCSTCHSMHEGSPALTNGTGTYCARHADQMKAKTAAATRRRSLENRGICPWCGDAVDDSNGQATKGDEAANVCLRCSRNVGWLRGCISHSDKPWKYVSRHEATAAPERELRRKKEEALAVAPVAPVAATPALDERIGRIMEEMLGKLKRELGA